MFTLHPRLQADTVFIRKLDLSGLYLMKDARYPWTILVPEQRDLSELHQLSEADYRTVTQEIRQVSEMMEQCFTPDKINIGALGNMVSQLHIHIIARFTSDASWPGPVWGVGEAETYTTASLDSRIAKIQKLL